MPSLHHAALMTVSRGMFVLWEVNQMEREYALIPGVQLNIDPSTLHVFESSVRHDFAGPRHTQQLDSHNRAYTICTQRSSIASNATQCTGV